MTPDTDRYLEFISPKVGDPTYSVLKAHLLFEELLNAFLARRLTHPDALNGSRLSFSQRLNLVRSLANSPPDHWIYQGVEKINSIRNALAHEREPKDIEKKVKSYVDFVVEKSGIPLPTPETQAMPANSGPNQTMGRRYAAVDVVTIGLYVRFHGLLEILDPLLVPPRQ